jgi:hypothetical protein
METASRKFSLFPKEKTVNARARGRNIKGQTPSPSLRNYRNDSFAGVNLPIAHARCFFPSVQRMRDMGFKCLTSFFSDTNAKTKARKKDNVCVSNCGVLGLESWDLSPELLEEEEGQTQGALQKKTDGP